MNCFKVITRVVSGQLTHLIMTVKQSTMDDSKDKLKSKVFYYEEKSGESTDQESVGSSEETESPRSVARIGRWTMAATKKMGHVHSQILRIREEDSYIGVDFGEVVADFVVFSKPILPASPLGGKDVPRLDRGV